MIKPVVEACWSQQKATGMVDDTSRLLGLHGLAVVGVADGPEGLVVQVQTGDERARLYPELTCGSGCVDRSGRTGSSR